MKLSFAQWARLGFGGLHLLQLYRQNVPVQTFAAESEALIIDVFPPEPVKDVISHTEAVEKIRTGALTPEEQEQFDRASNPGGAG